MTLVSLVDASVFHQRVPVFVVHEVSFVLSLVGHSEEGDQVVALVLPVAQILIPDIFHSWQ